MNHQESISWLVFHIYLHVINLSPRSMLHSLPASENSVQWGKPSVGIENRSIHLHLFRFASCYELETLGLANLRPNSELLAKFFNHILLILGKPDVQITKVLARFPPSTASFLSLIIASLLLLLWALELWLITESYMDASNRWLSVESSVFVKRLPLQNNYLLIGSQ